MKKHFRYGLFFALGAMLALGFVACGDESSSGPSKNEETGIETEVSSSSVDEVLSSSVNVEESSSSFESEGLSSSVESGASSSSEKSTESSSGKNTEPAEVYSCSVAEGSSSSTTVESSSSSVKIEQSSSSEKAEASSSSVKIQESSSSAKVEESSSSAKTDASSSSEKPAESSSSEKVVESSSSEKSSSSAGIPSKLYDCEIYKCVTTKYLNPDIEYGEYLDVRDTQVYRTVQIGEQVWMAQNLNYKNDNQSFCFDSDTLYCKEKGRLYTWENALKVCPEGWHLPDSSEYNALIDFVEKNNNGLPTKKSLTSGTFNIFGFSIILGSGYVVRGEYSNEGGGNGNSYFWTASETDGLDSSRPPETFARARGIRTSSNALVKLSWEKIHALAVRCIQN